MAVFEPGAYQPPELSAFRKQLEADSTGVFLNSDEFGQVRTVRYDGEVYENISIVLDEGVEVPHHNNKIMKTDHSKGLLKGQTRLYCQRADLGGHLPEVEDCLELESEKRQGFWIKYTVAESGCDEGMLNLLLKKVDE